MTQAVTISKPLLTIVPKGGTPVTVAYGPMQYFYLVNPATADDQGVPVAEVLYIDIVNQASLGETSTTMELVPGQSFSGVINQTSNVSVNAKTSGHRFSAIIIQPNSQADYTPPTGPFPPAGPSTLTQTIPSYLYEEYQDDDNLQAFVSAYNQLAQEFVNWFVNIGLPIYTGDQIMGPLLDWVGRGLYGYARPSLPSGLSQTLGPFNTYGFNDLAFDGSELIGPSNVFVTTDDIYKRCITWHFYKGDGKVFNIQWLKRRIMRFLIGVNGTAPNIDQTYQISVTFGVGNQVNINLVQGIREITGGALIDGFSFNSVPFNATESEFIAYNPLPDAAILQSAIDSGALELPFQYSYVVATT